MQHKDTRFLIDHAKLSFIRDRFLWNNLPCETDSDKDGFVILVSDERLTSYLNRLVFEWSHGRIEDVLLDNSNMANEEFRDRLLSNLRQRDKVEQSTLARITAPCAELQFSCLEICCLKGYSNLLPWIFDQGVDMNQCISSITPLKFACLQNRTNIIKELIDLGANVNKSGISGMTPLHAACYYENIDLAVLELLLKQKASADKRMFDGSTPLLVASYRLNREAVNILLNSSVDLNIGFYDTQTIKDGIKKMFRSITDEEEAIFWNLVLDFLSFVCVGQVKQILNLIMDIIGKATPLHFACLGIDTHIIKDLLDRNLDINIRKEDGSTPLFVACELGYVDVVRLLLEHNDDQNINKNDRTSPLDIAKQNKFAKIVTLLEETNTKSTSNGRKRKKYS